MFQESSYLYFILYGRYESHRVY